MQWYQFTNSTVETLRITSRESKAPHTNSHGRAVVNRFVIKPRGTATWIAISVPGLRSTQADLVLSRSPAATVSTKSDSRMVPVP